jgi:hypothetical protein
MRTHLQNNLSKMDWRCGSSGTVPALQVEFKTQSYQKKKKNHQQQQKKKQPKIISDPY